MRLLRKKGRGFWWNRVSYRLPGYVDWFHHYRVTHRVDWLVCGVRIWTTWRVVKDNVDEMHVLRAGCFGEPCNFWALP